ncbi:uncharacterized protein M8220_005461 isoform 4-T9 [Acridotheres tristis]
MLSFIGGLCVFRVDNQEDADFSCTAGAAEIQAEMHHSVFICVSRDTQVALLDRKILTKGGKITIFGLSGRQQIVCYSNHQSSKFPWSMDKSSNSLPLNSNEGKGEFQIQKDSDIGTQCLAHKVSHFPQLSLGMTTGMTKVSACHQPCCCTLADARQLAWQEISGRPLG